MELPSRETLLHGRVKPAQVPAPLTLALTAGLWALTLWAWQPLLANASSPPEAVSLPLEATAPSLFASPPRVVLALAQPPQANTSPAGRQRNLRAVQREFTALFGHVARELLKDEFDSVILKMSLGEQVAVHLYRQLQ